MSLIRFKYQLFYHTEIFIKCFEKKYQKKIPKFFFIFTKKQHNTDKGAKTVKFLRRLLNQLIFLYKKATEKKSRGA